MKCPFCQNDNLIEKQEPLISEGCDSFTVTQCCDNCGGSFEVVQEPQDILLKDALKNKPWTWRKMFTNFLKNLP